MISSIDAVIPFIPLIYRSLERTPQFWPVVTPVKQ